MKKLTTESFIEKVKTIHGDKFDYSLVEYSEYEAKVSILCKEHGEFQQTPHAHISGYGCKKCSCVQNTPYRPLLNETFIERARLQHGDLYDYSLVRYANAYTKVIIICKDHGKFEQVPHDHLSGCGCPGCKISKGEDKVKSYLILNRIEFEEQKSFVGCKDKYRLRFDFYLPEYNLLVEYDGWQHFKPFSFSSDKSKNTKEENLLSLQKRDNIKNQFAKDSNINLIRIPYWDYKNIDRILSKAIAEKTNIK